MMIEIDTSDLKNHAPLIPYVLKYYPDKVKFEKRSKDTMFCKCLWHQENTPSLAFFSNGSYKCFGCGAHGDVITFVQAVENVSFEEACKIIGDNVGYEINLEPPNALFESYKDSLDNHTRRYWVNLQKNKDALKYLKEERGISQEMIDRFRLGLTDANEYQFRTDIGNISNRLVFPILEHKRKFPKCVGMAYRTLTDEQPKYINDCNQDGREGQDPLLNGVFIKGNMIYGLHQSYEGINKFGYAILVEGYFDVISMHQSGITNTIATMGTSITDTQVNILSKITKNVLIMYDGDEAGISATIKAIKKFLSANITVAVCILDSGQDPADLCKSNQFNYTEISNTIRSHTSQAIEFVINNSVKQYENIAVKERIKALKVAMPIIDAIKDCSIKEMYISRLHKRLDI